MNAIAEGMMEELRPHWDTFRIPYEVALRTNSILRCELCRMFFCVILDVEHNYELINFMGLIAMRRIQSLIHDSVSGQQLRRVSREACRVISALDENIVGHLDCRALSGGVSTTHELVAFTYNLRNVDVMTAVHELPKFIDPNRSLLFIDVFISTAGSITFLHSTALRNDNRLSLIHIMEVEQIPLPAVREFPHLLFTRSDLKYMISCLLYSLFSPYPISYMTPDF